jgi:hypothetical protein
MDLISQFLGTAGEVSKVYTVVDFYTYIKGLEYLICVGFFVGFPILYRYINN